ncbi:MAG: folylpolyglutamate synthase/dihydrofolate synthase family protein [Acidobacteriota bacterium]
MDYTDAVRYLYSLGNEVTAAKLELENISAVLSFLGNPHRGFRAVHVAGTNGKGSVCAFIESVLRHAGYRTGLYTSPHLVRIEERIRFCGVMISEADFSRLTAKAKAAVDRLLEGKAPGSPRLARRPTYFETVTAIAFEYFAEQQAEIVVAEVGLGGRLDATNVLDPMVAVITNVDLDHQIYLGHRIDEIATEKAGIIKPRSYEFFRFSGAFASRPIVNLPVVLGEPQPVVKRIVQNRCAAAGAILVETKRECWRSAEPDPQGRFRIGVTSYQGSAPLDILVGLPGQHQVSNALTALTALEVLRSGGIRVEANDIRQGLSQTDWAGRLDVREVEGRRIVLDGGHNPAAAGVVRDHLKRFVPEGLAAMVYGSMRDKDVVEIGRLLFPLARTVILTEPNSIRSLAPAEIVRMHPELASRFRVTTSAPQALESALRATARGEVIAVVGSLYLVGEALEWLQRRANPTTEVALSEEMVVPPSNLAVLSKQGG